MSNLVGEESSLLAWYLVFSRYGLGFLWSICQSYVTDGWGSEPTSGLQPLMAPVMREWCVWCPCCCDKSIVLLVLGVESTKAGRCSVKLPSVAV